MSNPDTIAAALDQFFALPPDFQPDIDAVLATLDRDGARRYLAGRLEHDYVRSDCPVFQELFSRLGAGSEEPQLLRIFRDTSLPIGARACALGVLCGKDDRARRASLLQTLDDHTRNAIIHEPLRELVADAIEDSGAAIALAVITEHFPESRQLPLEKHIELVRKRMGATAATVYQPLLCSSRLQSTHESMINAIVEEAAPDAERALRCGMDAATDPSIKAKFTHALERLSLHVSAPPIDATGRLGPVDGPGRCEAAILVHNPEGTTTLAFLLLDGDEILDGFVDFDPPPELLHSEHLPSIEVPAAAIAWVVGPALQKADFDQLDSKTIAAVRLFERLPEAAPLPESEPSEQLEPGFVESLMQRPEYKLWTFVPEDFHESKLPEPPETPDEAWLLSAIEQLDRPEIRSRIHSDLRYMSRWHLAAGQPHEASGLARIARDIEHGFGSHALIRAMVARSVEVLHHPDLPQREIDDDRIDLEEIHEPRSIDCRILLRILDRQIRNEDPKAATEVHAALMASGASDEEARTRMVAVLESDLLRVIETEQPHAVGEYEANLRRLLE